MDDSTDYYCAISIIVLLTSGFSFIGIKLMCKVCRPTDFENVYIETENDTV